MLQGMFGDVLGGDTIKQGCLGERQPMSQSRGDKWLHIIGNNVIASLA